jgi:integrase
LSKTRTPKSPPDKRGYTDRELITLFGGRPKYNGLADLMVLGLFTGARIEELAGLTMGDVEFRADAFFLKLRTGKGTTRSRTIAVSHELPVSAFARRSLGLRRPERPRAKSSLTMNSHGELSL